MMTTEKKITTDDLASAIASAAAPAVTTLTVTPVAPVTVKKVAKPVTSTKIAMQATPAKAVQAVATAKTIKAVKAVKAPAKAATKPVVKPTAPVAKVAVKTDTKVVAKRPAAQVPKQAIKPLVQAKAEKNIKLKKTKLVRDSFTIPKAEFTVLDDLKQRAGKLASAVKKSELLRAGIKALAAMPDATFLAALKAVPTIKTGRPSKD